MAASSSVISRRSPNAVNDLPLLWCILGLYALYVHTGTWQTCGVFQADDWIKIAKDVPLNLAATLLVNPCTAYRMLKDFVQLKEGMYRDC